MPLCTATCRCSGLRLGGGVPHSVGPACDRKLELRRSAPDCTSWPKPCEAELTTRVPAIAPEPPSGRLAGVCRKRLTPARGIRCTSSVSLNVCHVGDAARRGGGADAAVVAWPVEPAFAIAGWLDGLHADADVADASLRTGTLPGPPSLAYIHGNVGAAAPASPPTSACRSARLRDGDTVQLPLHGASASPGSARLGSGRSRSFARRSDNPLWLLLLLLLLPILAIQPPLPGRSSALCVLLPRPFCWPPAMPEPLPGLPARTLTPCAPEPRLLNWPPAPMPGPLVTPAPMLGLPGSGECCKPPGVSFGQSNCILSRLMELVAEPRAPSCAHPPCHACSSESCVAAAPPPLSASSILAGPWNTCQCGPSSSPTDERSPSEQLALAAGGRRSGTEGCGERSLGLEKGGGRMGAGPKTPSWMSFLAALIFRCVGLGDAALASAAAAAVPVPAAAAAARECRRGRVARCRGVGRVEKGMSQSCCCRGRVAKNVFRGNAECFKKSVGRERDAGSVAGGFEKSVGGDAAEGMLQTGGRAHRHA
eukprot:357152-Chlamydomonas_euryale.AAC.3